MRPPRWKALVDKSIAACCAAIEIYNKPVVPHREETFAILVVTAWELLLKARLIQANGNRLKAIYETETVRTKDGKPTKRRRVQRNNAGNPITISISKAVGRAMELPRKPLDPACKHNLELLMEVRNNAVHFINDDRDLAIHMHEIGVAALRNYAALLADWFERDISDLRFAILPLSFDGAVAAQVVPPAKRSQHAQNLLAHMMRAVAEAPPSQDGRFAVSLRVETKIVGASSVDATPVKLSKGLGGVPVEITEAEFLRRWPYDYKRMIHELKKRLPGMVVNKAFRAHLRMLSGDERLVKERRLDLINPNSKSTKKYYSQGMVDAMVARLSASQAGGPAGSAPAA
jgi:hypothetical protein